MGKRAHGLMKRAGINVTAGFGIETEIPARSAFTEPPLFVDETMETGALGRAELHDYEAKLRHESSTAPDDSAWRSRARE
jgi:hypothetical protein